MQFFNPSKLETSEKTFQRLYWTASAFSRHLSGRIDRHSKSFERRKHVSILWYHNLLIGSYPIFKRQVSQNESGPISDFSCYFDSYSSNWRSQLRPGHASRLFHRHLEAE